MEDKIVNKILTGLGAIFSCLLLVSTATAIPQTYSEPTMDMIDTIEQNKYLNEKLENLFGSTGIIDWIVQLLQMILNFIKDLIQFVLDLFQIVNLINLIISAINQLINLIAQLIQSIIDIFTPNSIYYQSIHQSSEKFSPNQTSL